MALKPHAMEIIDLTEPEVIELNSDGEVVPDPDATAEAGTSNGAGSQPQQQSQQDQRENTALTQPEQAKKKRKKRKRKPTGANASANASAAASATEREEGEIGTSGAEASRPHSRSSPNRDAFELHVETVHDEGEAEVVPVSASGEGKKSLADRLTDPTPKGKRERDEAREGKRERREKYKDRRRDRDRDKERDRDRDRRKRSRSREREHYADRPRRRSRSRDREKRRRDPAQEEPSAPLFFEDVTPAEVPDVAKPPGSINGPPKEARSNNDSDTGEKSADGLLLPPHVSVALGEEDPDTSQLKVPTPEGSDDEDYIDYLDYDDDRRAPGMVRYWELDKVAAAEALKPAKFVCKNCGAEGEHKTYECPVLICLTCGARDEHSTRSCPISKTCFTCGMKGHINKTCPNRAATRAGMYTPYQDCDRCGARTHQMNECPTLWRIYEYVDDDERQEILRVRETKRTLALGEGGEGYIATDEWCYNCGGCGHLGDDCTDRPKPFDVPREPSAFSLYNILSGPFSSEASRPSKRAPRDWEALSSFADGFGFVAPMEVGKQARKKERARLERRARELEEQDDQDDWFDAAQSRARSGGGGNGTGRSPRRDRGGRGASKANGAGKMRFDFSHSSLDRDRDRQDREGGGRDRKRQRVSYYDPPGPSRETDSIQIRGAAKKQDRDRSGSNGNNSRDRYDRDAPSRGPRYRGGYSR
ncbi:hypothetical protein BD414DRAFT_579052 [Trametes punicea]|nr:hypothetical protein BD414DRAFT_579052 [Trametes punicea]